MLRKQPSSGNSFLHYDKSSDRWVSSPSYSPEHGTITIGNTFDQSLVWQLFHDYMEAANHLNVDQDLVTEVKAKFDNLNHFILTKMAVSRNGTRKTVLNSPTKALKTITATFPI